MPIVAIGISTSMWTVYLFTLIIPHILILQYKKCIYIMHIKTFEAKSMYKDQDYDAEVFAGVLFDRLDMRYFAHI